MRSIEGYYAHEVISAANNDEQAAALVASLGERRINYIDSSTSRNVFLVIDGCESRTMAFVSKGTNDIHFNADHAKAANNAQIDHVITHEEEHSQRPWDLDMKVLSNQQAQTLATVLDSTVDDVLNATNWIEGSVEYQTILEEGTDQNVAYLHHEVPLYKRLCDLMKMHLQKDFHKSFKVGREAEIVSEMADLADIVEFKNTLLAA